MIGDELRAIIAPPLRKARGEVFALINEWSAVVGKPTDYDEPLPVQWRRIVSASRDVQGFDDTAVLDGPKILIASGYGLSEAKCAFESIIGVALKQRGASPVILSCDATLSACEFNPNGNCIPTPPGLESGPRARRAICNRCRTAVTDVFTSVGLPQISLQTYMRPEDWGRAEVTLGDTPYDDYRTFEYRSIRVGDHAFSSMLRATLRGTLNSDEATQLLFRRYLLTAITYVDMLERLFDDQRPDRVVAPHGVYLVHGTLCEVARKRNIPVVIWGFPYRQGTVWLSHDDTYHRTLVTDPNDVWENEPFTPADDQQVEAYLESKRGGGRDYVNYHPNPLEDRERICQALDLDPNRPIISLFTNVIWDAQIYYDFNVFENILDWVFSTIEYFAGREDLQLVIRVHPAEVKGGMPTRQPIVPEITRRFPTLPKNVRIVPPESDISSYTLAEMSQAALIYGTKMGLEIAVRGIPVIVAGETFNRGKGFTYDVQTKQEYYALLDRADTLPRNTQTMIERARKYAFYLFFRRMIDFPLLTVRDPHRSLGLRLAFSRLDQLKPGLDQGLDIMCRGILDRAPFVSAGIAH